MSIIDERTRGGDHRLRGLAMLLGGTVFCAAVLFSWVASTPSTGSGVPTRWTTSGAWPGIAHGFAARTGVPT
jgi:hypothetical protein